MKTERLIKASKRIQSDHTTHLNVFSIITSKVNGPGKRIVIHLQGCNLACRRCFNKQSWAFKEVHNVHYEDLFKKIKHIMKEDPEICGVTFSGGEPLLQINPLIKILSMCKKSYIQTMVYTGFEHEEYEEFDKIDDLYHVVDIMVANRYNYKIPQKHPWAGSGNQRVFSPNGSAVAQIADAKNIRRTEIRIDINGNIIQTGFPFESIKHKL